MLPPELLQLGPLQAIGNGRSGALVGPRADISWWTPGTIEHDAAFYSLVHRGGGELSLRLPGTTCSSTSRSGDAPVLCTTVRSPDATVTIHDHMAAGTHGFGDGTIVRLVSVLAGRAEFHGSVVGGSRFATPRRTYRGSDSVAWVSTDLGAAVIGVRGIDPDGAMVLHQGESLMVTVSPYARDERVRREVYDRSVVDMQRTWRRELDNGYDGPLRSEVRGWLQQLLLLTNTESGAIMRSFTTSLPTHRGGERQVDERLAHLDDAARFVRLCERIDRYDHAEQTRRWIADALARGTARARHADGTDANGETDLMLSGWLGHQPVRRGDIGATSTDLAAVAAASLVLDAARDRRVIAATASRLAEQFRTPTLLDSGRWAGRLTGRRGVRGQAATRWVSSAIAVRIALRAAAATERRHDPLSLDAVEWDAVARELGLWLRADGCFGVDATAGWRRAFDDDSSDAQLLRWIAPADRSVDLPDLPDDHETEAWVRTTNTVGQTTAQLDDHGLVHRHFPHADDGFAPGQGADVSATADLVSALCRLGRWDEANSRMELLLTCIDAGADHDADPGAGVATVPSHLDPRTSAHLGNRPHAPALLSLCEAAIALRSGPR